MGKTGGFCFVADTQVVIGEVTPSETEVVANDGTTTRALSNETFAWASMHPITAWFFGILGTGFVVATLRCDKKRAAYEQLFASDSSLWYTGDGEEEPLTYHPDPIARASSTRTIEPPEHSEFFGAEREASDMPPLRSRAFLEPQSHGRWTSLRSVLGYCVSACLFLLCLTGLWNFHTPSPPLSAIPACTHVSYTPAPPPDSTPPPAKYVTKSIQDIVPGDRVLGANPELPDVERAGFAEPRPDSVYRYMLLLPKDDDSPTVVELLRPRDWLESEETAESTDQSGTMDESASVWLDLPEMGAVGWAKLIAVSEVESFSTGSGNLVTGTFCHLATQTIDLVIDGVAPIGCTPNHPFWSVDRRAFVNAGELLVGENVQLYSGETKRVVQKLARPGPELVYNIEKAWIFLYYRKTRVAPSG